MCTGHLMAVKTRIECRLSIIPDRTQRQRDRRQGMLLALEIVNDMIAKLEGLGAKSCA